MPLTDAQADSALYTLDMIKILLVDDDPNVRRGVRMRLSLEPEFAVIGETGDGWEALRLVRELDPDVVVMDIRLPSLDGLSAAERLHAVRPACPVIILTLYDEPANRLRASNIGVSAFISKQDPDGDLVAAIRNSNFSAGGTE